MSDLKVGYEKVLVPVEPQPEPIIHDDPSVRFQRWRWVSGGKLWNCLRHGDRPWWKVVPKDALPHPNAEAVQASGKWYWVVEKGLEDDWEALRKSCADLRLIAEALGLHEDDLHIDFVASACIEAIGRLKEDLRKAVLAKSPVLVRHVPWGLAGTPGSEPPKKGGERICLAIATEDDIVRWALVDWMPTFKRWVDIDDGEPVEVLEYWPLHPAEDGWEQTWRRKTPE